MATGTSTLPTPTSACGACHTFALLRLLPQGLGGLLHQAQDALGHAPRDRRDGCPQALQSGGGQTGAPAAAQGLRGVHRDRQPGHPGHGHQRGQRALQEGQQVHPGCQRDPAGGAGQRQARKGRHRGHLRVERVPQRQGVPLPEELREDLRGGGGGRRDQGQHHLAQHQRHPGAQQQAELRGGLGGQDQHQRPAEGVGVWVHRVRGRSLQRHPGAGEQGLPDHGQQQGREAVVPGEQDRAKDLPEVRQVPGGQAAHRQGQAHRPLGQEQAGGHLGPGDPGAAQTGRGSAGRRSRSPSGSPRSTCAWWSRCSTRPRSR